MQTIAASAPAPRPARTAAWLVGLLAVACIILFEQLIGAFKHLGLPLGVSIWVAMILGEWAAIGVSVLYLRRTNRPVRPLLIAPVALRWWEVTLLPLGLWLLSAVLGYAGQTALGLLFRLPAMDARAALAMVPHSPLELGLAAVAAVTAGICEEFIFRSFLVTAFAEFAPRWLAAAAALPLFYLIHVQGFSAIGALWIAIWALPLTIYAARTRKVAPVMIAHGINDFVNFVILMPLLARMVAH